MYYTKRGSFFVCRKGVFMKQRPIVALAVLWAAGYPVARCLPDGSLGTASSLIMAALQQRRQPA
ncbi:hypothetical protein [Paenibacillus larvae]|uniref:hypothetical protein n=1 Tax=Paenibacillus larvae TaxID=1464 RepID=UPI0028914B45|nr:hypothetical protein [Paenibacillus larvae]MDT2193805.1 hypothetical protein [Paenibacillus larvae]